MITKFSNLNRILVNFKGLKYLTYLQKCFLGRVWKYNDFIKYKFHKLTSPKMLRSRTLYFIAK